MAGNEEKCKRSQDCTCTACRQANEAFSVNDLKKITSGINWAAEAQAEDANGVEEIPMKVATKARTPQAKRAPTPVKQQVVVEEEESVPTMEPPQPALAQDKPVDLEEERSLGAQSSSSGASQKSPTQKRPPSASPPPEAPGEQPSEQEGDKPPIDIGEIDQESLGAKLTDKNWKLRKDAFAQLEALFKAAAGPEEPIFATYGPMMPTFLNETNPSCMDAVLDAALAFADRGPCDASAAEAQAPVVIAKAFGGRPATVNRGKEVLMKMMEVDTPEPVVMALMEALGDKKPKIPPLCLQCIVDACKAFGGMHMPLKAIRPKLKGLFESTQAPIREGAQALLVEMVRCYGPKPFDEMIQELRSAQQTSVKGAIEGIVPGQCVPTVGLRKFAGKSGSGQAKSGGGGGGGGAHEGDSADVPQPGGVIDIWDMLDPVDLLGQLPKSEFNEKIAEAKWNEKVAGLQVLMKLMGDPPKLMPGEYGDLVRTLKGLVNHSHYQVSINSVKALGMLSVGLREKFSPWGPPLVPVLFQKAKDKKVMEAVSEALDMLYGKSVSFESIIEELEALVDPKKNLVVGTRFMALGWIKRSLPLCVNPRSAKAEVSPEMKTTLMKMGIRALEDPDAKVREEAGSMLTKLVEVSNSTGPAKAHRALLSMVEDLKTSHAKVYKKIVEGGGDSTPSDAAEAAPTVATTRPAVSRTTAGGGSSGDAGTKTTSLSSTTRPGLGTTARKGMAGTTRTTPRARTAASSSSSSARPPSSNAPSGGGGPAVAKQEDTEDDTPLTISIDEATERLATLGLPGWENEIIPMLASAKWQDRKDAFVAIRQAIEGLGESAPPDLLALLSIFISEQTKKFKDSNVNVIKEAMETLKTAAGLITKPGPSERSAMGTLVPVFTDRLTDRKLKDIALAFLTSAAETMTPSFVMRRVIKLTAAAKAPAQHVESMGWIKSCVAEFGAATVPVQALVGFCTTEVENSNVNIRKAAIDVLGTLYKQVGPPLRRIAVPEGLKKAVADTILAEFDKVGYDPNTASVGITRKIKAGDGEGGGGSSAGGGGSGGLGSLVPRADLDSLLDKGILERMGCLEGKTAWQGRKAAIEEVLTACDKSAHFLEGNRVCAEVLKGLKARLADSQSNLKPMAATAIGEVISSLEEQIAPRYVRLISDALLSGVADIKKPMRDACLAALGKIMTLNHPEGNPTILESLFPDLEKSLMAKTGNGRTELLELLKRYLPCLTCDTNILVGPFLLSLQDKTATTRAAAEECLTILLRSGCIKFAAVQNGTRDFSPAVKRSLNEPLKRLEVAATQGPLPTVNTTEAPTATEASPPSGKMSPVGLSQPSSSLPMPMPPPVSEPKVAPPPVPPASRRSSVARSEGKLEAKERGSLGTTMGGGGGVASMATTSREAVNDVGLDTSSVSSFSQGPLKRNDLKKKREEDFKRTKWVVPPEEPRFEESDQLKAQWAPLLQPGEEGIDKLFPNVPRKGIFDTAVYIGGIDLLTMALDEQYPAYVDNLDLIFKWFTLRLCDKENVQVLQKLLELMLRTVQTLADNNYSLKEFEAAILIPFILEKSGQAKDRFRRQFRRLMALICDIYPYTKYVPMVVTAAASKNTRTRVACLDEVRRILEGNPLTNLRKAVVKDVVKYVEAREQDVRSAALDVVHALFERLDRDTSKLAKILEGGTVSDKTKQMIEDRCRDWSKSKTSTLAVGGTPGKASSSRTATPYDDDRSVESVPSRANVFSKTATSSQTATLGRTMGGGAGGGRTSISAPPSSGAQGPFCLPGDDIMEPIQRPQASTTTGRISLDTGFIPIRPALDSPSRGDTATFNVYNKVIETIDRFLGFSNPVRSDQFQYTEALDALRLLSSSAAHQATPEQFRYFGGMLEEEAQRQHAVEIVERVLKCVRKSFVCAPPDPTSALGTVDIKVLSAAVFCLKSMYSNLNFVTQLTVSTIQETIAEVVGRLDDPHLTGALKEPENKEAVEKLLNFLKVLAHDVMKSAQNHNGFVALLNIMFEYRKEQTDPRSKGMEVVINGFRDLVKNERNRNFEHVDLSKLLPALDTLLAKGDGDEFSRAGALLSEALVDVLGIEKIKQFLGPHIHKPTSALYRWYCEGKNPEVSDLLMKFLYKGDPSKADPQTCQLSLTLSIILDDDWMDEQKLFEVLRSTQGPLIGDNASNWTEYLEGYDLSDYALRHLMDNFNAIEQAASGGASGTGGVSSGGEEQASPARNPSLNAGARADSRGNPAWNEKLNRLRGIIGSNTTVRPTATAPPPAGSTIEASAGSQPKGYSRSALHPRNESEDIRGVGEVLQKRGREDTPRPGDTPENDRGAFLSSFHHVSGENVVGSTAPSALPAAATSESQSSNNLKSRIEALKMRGIIPS